MAYCNTHRVLPAISVLKATSIVSKLQIVVCAKELKRQIVSLVCSPRAGDTMYRGRRRCSGRERVIGRASLRSPVRSLNGLRNDSTRPSSYLAFYLDADKDIDNGRKVAHMVDRARCSRLREFVVKSEKRQRHAGPCRACGARGRVVLPR